jgi:hypothetical protein
MRLHLLRLLVVQKEQQGQSEQPPRLLREHGPGSPVPQVQTVDTQQMAQLLVQQAVKVLQALMEQQLVPPLAQVVQVALALQVAQWLF